MPGRGEYYKNKYGSSQNRGGRGGRGGHVANDAGQSFGSQTAGAILGDWNKLEEDLRSINGQQYGAYKRLLGKYQHASPTFTLSVDYVQGDPYASPSRVRAIMPWRQSAFPDEYLQNDIRRIALCDFVTRVCAAIIRAKHLDENVSSGGGWSGRKGGAFSVNAPGQEVLPRTSAMIDGDKTIDMRFTTTLPAAGRTILGQQAYQILAVNLVELVEQSLLFTNLNQNQLQEHIQCAENQHMLRQQLAERDLIGFVANGSVLPRASGASATPMTGASVVPLQSPEDLEVTLPLPDDTKVTGMGIPRGITLLTGGGFHGKSTLLEALQLGIYNHIPGDGRELIVIDPTAVKIRAEDGRAVSSVDISPFISNLPGGKDTKRFSTDDASGSTSMAANIQEALEVGCKTLLIDEDSSATNLLVRDQRMQSLIQNEPIIPLVAKARALYTQHGVSTVIVVGGLGDWLAVADHVIAMDSYLPRHITANAKAIIERYPSEVTQTVEYGSLPSRSLQVDLRGSRSPYASQKKFISLKPQSKDPVDNPAEAEAGIDLSGMDQIVEKGQSRTIATVIEQIAKQTNDGPMPLHSPVQAMQQASDLDRCLPVSMANGDMVGVRRAEIAAALSRMRGIRVS